MAIHPLTSPVSRPVQWNFSAPLYFLVWEQPHHNAYYFDGTTYQYSTRQNRKGRDSIMFSEAYWSLDQKTPVDGWQITGYGWSQLLTLSGSDDSHSQGMSPTFGPGPQPDQVTIAWPPNMVGQSHHDDLSIRVYETVGFTVLISHELNISPYIPAAPATFQQFLRIRVYGERLVIGVVHNTQNGNYTETVLLYNLTTGVYIATLRSHINVDYNDMESKSVYENIAITADRIYVNGYAFDHEGASKGATPFADMHGDTYEQNYGNYSVFAANNDRIGRCDNRSVWRFDSPYIVNVVEHTITKGGPGVDDTYTPSHVWTYPMLYSHWGYMIADQSTL